MPTLRHHLDRLLSPVADGARVVPEAPAVPARVLFRRFWPYARPYRGRIAAGLLLLVLVPALETVEIWLFKVMVDEVLVPRDLSPLVWIVGAWLALALAGALVSFGDELLAAWVGERFVADLRARLFSHLHTLSPTTLDRRRLGDVVSRLTSDVQAIEAFLLAGLADGIGALARIALFGGAMFLVSWKLALVALVIVPLCYAVGRHCSRLVKRAAREKRRRSGSLAAVAEESLGNAVLVRSLNREGAELARFRRESEAIVGAELAATRVRALFSPLVDLIELAGVLLVVAAGAWLLTEGEMTLGGLLVFLAYLSQMLGPVRELGHLANALFAAAAGAERVLELLDERPRVDDRPAARPLPAGAGGLEMRGVGFRYPGAGRPALDDVSLCVEPGEIVAVAGPSGAGKSTIARLLLRIDDPGAGAVLLGGHDLRDLTLASVREHVALVAQETLLPDAAVAEVIGHGRPGASAAEIEEAARRAGAHGFIAALPDGYATRVGQRGRTLSGGQRQRLSLARALLRDAPVLVLDEPTTGLDAAARDALLGPLARAAAGRTVVLISHDPAVVALADRVVEIEDGRIVAAPEVAA
jgi:ABC-type multidrug transport system fused ATPase/permease subunit